MNHFSTLIISCYWSLRLNDAKSLTMYVCVCDGRTEDEEYVYISASVCVLEICSTLKLLFCHIPFAVPVWHSVRARPVTFSGSWTPGPFSVTLCCHFWLLSAQSMMHSQCWGENDIQPTSRFARLKVVFPLLHQTDFRLHRISLAALMKKKRSFLRCNMYSRIEKSNKTSAFDICDSLKLMQIWGISATVIFPMNPQFSSFAKSKITNPKKKYNHQYLLIVHHITVYECHCGLFNCPWQNQIGLVPAGVCNCMHLIHKSGS